MNQKVSLAAVASPVRVPKTAELVASHLRRQIVRGELKEGDALPPESALMDQFGVSRPTLREAFRVLESEALISVRRGARGGARVHTPDANVAARYAGLVLQFRGATLADVYAGRRAIELAALAMLASRKPSAAALKPLERNLDEMDAHADDPAKMALLLQDFHRLLVDVARNQTLTIFAEMIDHVISLQGEAYVARTSHQPETRKGAKDGTRTHHRLLELLRAGKGVDAIDLWRRHLDEASAIVLRGAGATTVLDSLA